MKKILLTLLCLVGTRTFASEMLLDEPPISERRASLLSSLGSLVNEMDERIHTPNRAKEVFEELAPAQVAVDALIHTFEWSQNTLPRFKAMGIKYRLDSIQNKGIRGLDTWTYNLYNSLPYYDRMDSTLQQAFLSELLQYTETFNSIMASSRTLSEEQQQRIIAIQARLAHIRKTLGFDAM